MADVIGKITLHQNGAFDAKLQFVYHEGDKLVHLDGSPDIEVGHSSTLDPGKFGVPAKAEVSLYVFVVWGSDNQGREIFTYVPGSPKNAEYTITGTTLNNALRFDGITG
jgi:hypothetical protein